MDIEFSENTSKNETIREQSENFILLLENQHNCFQTTKNNGNHMMHNTSKFIKDIEKLDIRELAEDATANLNLVKDSSHERKHNAPVNMEAIKEITDCIEDRERNLEHLRKEIKLLETKRKDDILQCTLEIAAHKKAIQYYATNFNVKIQVVDSNEGQTEIQVVFENQIKYSTNIIFDRDNNILYFKINSKSTEEHNEITRLVETKDYVDLMIKLRRYILTLK